jgi:hypothetical protein
MARLSTAAAVFIVAMVAFVALPCASGRVLRPHSSASQPALPRAGEDARGALRSLLKDKASDVDLQGGPNRPWPATRPIATTSGRGAPAGPGPSRSYGYSSNASPVVMNAGMNEPVSEGMWGQRG